MRFCGLVHHGTGCYHYSNSRGLLLVLVVNKNICLLLILKIGDGRRGLAGADRYLRGDIGDRSKKNVLTFPD